MGIKRFALSFLASVAVLAAAAAAQDAAVAQEGRTPARAEVAAGATASGVRFVAAGAAHPRRSLHGGARAPLRLGVQAGQHPRL